MCVYIHRVDNANINPDLIVENFILLKEATQAVKSKFVGQTVENQADSYTESNTLLVVNEKILIKPQHLLTTQEENAAQDLSNESELNTPSVPSSYSQPSSKLPQSSSISTGILILSLLLSLTIVVLRISRTCTVTIYEHLYISFVNFSMSFCLSTYV